MRLASLLFAAAFVLLAAPVSAQTAATEASLTPICAVADDPQRFDGQEVTVRGIFASDYFEYSSLGDPVCGRALAPWNIVRFDPPGENAFQALLCDEQGGLVEVSVKGRVEARPDQIPSSRFYVLEYSDPRHVALDPEWEDRHGVLAREATANWQGIRRHFCIIEGFVDPETFQRRTR